MIDQLSTELKDISGTVTFPAGSNRGIITLSTIPDEKPEFASWFFVNLTSVSSGAVIKNSGAVSNVTMTESDYPSGRIGFAVRSR